MTHARGFTLIEVMVAMVIFAIGFLALAQLQVIASRSANSAQRNNVADALVGALSARLQSLSYSDPLLADTTTTNDSAQGAPGYNLEAPGAAVDHCIITLDGVPLGAPPSSWASCQSSETMIGLPDVSSLSSSPDGGNILYYLGWDVEDANLRNDIARADGGALIAFDSKVVVSRVMWRDPAMGNMRTVSAVSIVYNPSIFSF